MGDDSIFSGYFCFSGAVKYRTPAGYRLLPFPSLQFSKTYHYPQLVIRRIILVIPSGKTDFQLRE
jgi:hypothetical protein